MAQVAAARFSPDTRSKLILAAGEVFAEFGFEGATTREICARANANVAAIHYYFRDKLGLYTETLKLAVGKGEISAIAATLLESNPEEALRAFLQATFRHIGQTDRPAWITKVMANELSRPTPGLAIVVDQIVRPRALLLREIVSRILGWPPEHPQSRLCAHSIIGQAVHYLHARPVIERLWPEWQMTPAAIDEIANHVFHFSLAALKNLPISKVPPLAASNPEIEHE